MQLDISTVITIGGATLAVIGALIKIIRDMDMKRIEMTEKDLAEANRKLEIQREYLADIRETIAGFGATYVTRREFDERKHK